MRADTLEGTLLAGPRVRIAVAGSRIRRVEPLPEERAAGSTREPVLLPGLVDLQVNGYAGHDLNAETVSVDEVAGLTHALWAAGTTTYFPTIVTASPDRILNALATVAAARRSDPLLAHSIAGVHVEGPALSEHDGARGAHDRRWLRDPDVDELDRWVDASEGLLRIVTLAPERDGSAAFIERARRAGVLVSIGHSDATSEQVHGAARAGATLSTHLGNGIQPMLPRHPNPIWAQLADERLAAGLIADGEHLPADTFVSMVRAKGAGRCFLVSDSAALAGSVPGEYRTPVGGRVVVTATGRLELARSGLLAGSGSSLAGCLRWALRETTLPPPVLLSMCTDVPAALVGLGDRGALGVGSSADLVVLDRRLQVQRVVVAGITVVDGGEPVAPGARRAAHGS